MSVFKDHLINRLLLERNEPAQRAGKSTQRDSNSRSKPIRSRSETRQKSTSSELTRELPSRALVRQPGQAVVRTNKIADSTDSTERISHALVAKLRQRATKRYVCRLVRPVRFDFQPKNWQDRPLNSKKLSLCQIRNSSDGRTPGDSCTIRLSCEIRRSGLFLYGPFSMSRKNNNLPNFLSSL